MGFFGRAPDNAGLAFWSAEIDRGLVPVDIALQFAEAPEFPSMYGALTAREQVDLAYRNILQWASDLVTPSQ